MTSSRVQFGLVTFCPPHQRAVLAAADEAAGFDNAPPFGLADAPPAEREALAGEAMPAVRRETAA